MADRVTAETRSKIMAAVKQRDTGPEMALRRALHALGYRYRTNVRALPGSPDLVFPARKKAIYVHGCFWHGHACPRGKRPESRRDYWIPKITGNRRRDRRNAAELRSLGWEALVVWECELRENRDAELRRVVRFLGERVPHKRHYGIKEIKAGQIWSLSRF